MKTDSKVSLPLLGILLVAVIGLVLYLAWYVLAHFGIPVASIWIYVALALVPAAADAHRVLLCPAQAGQRLAGVEDDAALRAALAGRRCAGALCRRPQPAP